MILRKWFYYQNYLIETPCYKGHYEANFNFLNRWNSFIFISFNLFNSRPLPLTLILFLLLFLFLFFIFVYFLSLHFFFYLSSSLPYVLGSWRSELRCNPYIHKLLKVRWKDYGYIRFDCQALRATARLLMHGDEEVVVECCLVCISGFSVAVFVGFLYVENLGLFVLLGFLAC